MSWRNGVVYQIYPRSFQDSDDDGVGDLAGITARLDHLAWLGVDALWISPFYPSPLADFGYDVSDYTDVDPMFGSLPDFDRLVAAAHERGLKVLLDLVACHTSIQHPWFRDHPEWYVWSEGDRPPNNWTAAFGGPAWSRYDDEHWYLHSFYPEQPDLDWRNPDVVAAMQEVVRFWVARGADGFRLDAIDRLAKDPQLRDDPPATEPFGLPLLEHESGRDLRYSRNAEWIGEALAAIREAAGDALLIGEVYLPVTRHAPYLEHLDRSFVFELILSPWDPEPAACRARRGRGHRGPQRPGRGVGAVEPRLRALSDALRPRANERAGALMLMTLPGTATLYQGDEIGQGMGPGGDPPYDRFGRDGFRHPMQWDGTAGGGFSDGAAVAAADRPGCAQRGRSARRPRLAAVVLASPDRVAARPRLRAFGMIESAPGVIAYERGDKTVAVNAGNEPARCTGRRSGARDVGRCVPSAQARARGRRHCLRADGRRDTVRRVETGRLGKSRLRRVCERLRSRSWSQLAAMLVAGGCGGDDSGGSRTLRWYVFAEPGGAFKEAAANCTKEARGRYKVEVVDLPTNADQQRELVVRRLAAEDSDIDIIGMDVIWTAEFAEAEWIKEITGADRERAGAGRAARPARDRQVQGPPVDGALHEQHAAALVPQGPGEGAAQDVGRDDRRGGAPEDHRPGAVRPLRGPGRVVQLAGRPRRVVRSWTTRAIPSSARRP